MPKPIRITDTRYQAAFAHALLPQSVEELWQAFAQLRERPDNLAVPGTLPTLPFATDVASVASSQIEGNSIDLNFFMQSKRRGEVAKPKKREFREIEHLIEAYTFAQTHELSEKNFLRVHTLLSKQFLITSKRGTYRNHGMMIQSTGGIEYIAPEPEYLASAMSEFWRDVETLCATALTPEAAFYHAALLHLVFVHIHPFSDGNGRSVRILEKWFLAQHLGAWAWRVPSETFYLERRKDYYAAIKLGVNYYELDYGRCVPFLVMLARAVEVAIKQTIHEPFSENSMAEPSSNNEPLKNTGGTYNLLKEAWIPVLREDGTSNWIAPHQLTEGLCGDGKSPIMRLDSNRADFNAAIAQFLIGLFQTAFAPETEAEWEYDYKNPPTPDELQEAFRHYTEFFWLDGEGARFMQDSSVLDSQEEEIIDSSDEETEEGEVDNAGREVRLLLIDAPQKNAERKNSDFFIKRKTTSSISYASVAAALMLRQFHTPNISSKWYSNIRSTKGEGNLTTLIFDNYSLWKTIWLNILPDSVVRLLYPINPNKSYEPKTIFPWMGFPVNTNNDEKQRKIYPSMVHPLTVFWATPVRYWIHFDDNKQGQCSISHQENQPLIEEVKRGTFGRNYKGSWLHPLSPIVQKDFDMYQYLQTPSEPIAYNHWLGILQIKKEKNEVEKPALVIDYLLNTSKYLEVSNNRWQIVQRTNSNTSIWVFGFDFKKASALRWQDSKVPIIFCGGDVKSEFELLVEILIFSARTVVEKLIKALKEAAVIKGKIDTIEVAFWQKTEYKFYQILSSLSEMSSISRKDIEQQKKSWLTIIRDTAKFLFEAATLSILPGNKHFEDVIQQRIKLFRKDFSDKMLYELLELPLPPKSETKKNTSPSKNQQTKPKLRATSKSTRNSKQKESTNETLFP